MDTEARDGNSNIVISINNMTITKSTNKIMLRNITFTGSWRYLEVIYLADITAHC